MLEVRAALQQLHELDGRSLAVDDHPETCVVDMDAGLDQHLWLGIAASFAAAGAWLLILQSWRVRVVAQIAAVVVMTIAAHIGGAKVHGDLFKPNKESQKAAEPKAVADRPPIPLG
jgi:hypothetical protein